MLFTILYRDPETKFVYIKRCRVEQYIINRDYVIIPDGMELLHVDTREKFNITLNYEPKPRLKILKETFKAQSFEEKGLKAQGVRLASKETASIEIDASKSSGFIQGELDLDTKPAPKTAKTEPEPAKSALATMELKKAAKPAAKAKTTAAKPAAKTAPAKAVKAKAEKPAAKAKPASKASDVSKASPKKAKSALATLETKPKADEKPVKKSLTARAEALKNAKKDGGKKK